MILAAAIRKNGVTLIGKRHHLIPNLCGGEQGFITTDGIFLDRKKAAKHALECGQIKELKYQKNELFSEELW